MGIKRGRLWADAQIYCGNRAVEKDISIARFVGGDVRFRLSCRKSLRSYWPKAILKQSHWQIFAPVVLRCKVSVIDVLWRVDWGLP